MTVNVDISPDVLNWIVHRIRIQSVSEKTMNYINSWIKGDKKPTFNQIEDVSKATGIPFGYFFLKTPPNEDISFVEYRTVDSIELQNPSRDLIDTMHDMELIQDWTKDYIKAAGEPSIQFVGKYNNISDYTILADRIRKLLSLSVDWCKSFRNAEEEFNNLKNIISNLGVLVMANGIVANNTHRALDINEFRAFAIVDEYAPLIFINRNDSINGRLFSLLHEFVHICLGVNSLFNDRKSTANNINEIEVICNAVAAEILLPQNLFIEAWKNEDKQTPKEEVIKNIARIFNCGVTVVARKAMDNKLISRNLYNAIADAAINSFNELKAKSKESGESGGDYYATTLTRIDKRFLKMLINSVNEGKTQYSEAYRLTNTNRRTFSALVTKAGDK